MSRIVFADLGKVVITLFIAEILSTNICTSSVQARTNAAGLAFTKELKKRLESRDSKHGGKYCTGSTPDNTEKQIDFLFQSKSEISRKPFYKLRVFLDFFSTPIISNGSSEIVSIKADGNQICCCDHEFCALCSA